MIPTPELLLGLPPATLSALLAALGPVPSLPARADHATVVRHLFTHPSCSPSSLSSSPPPFRLPLKLEDFLASTLPRFGTPAGRLALLEAGQALGDKRIGAWFTMPAAQPVTLLAIEAATGTSTEKKRAKKLLEAARKRTDRDLLPRPTYELACGSSPSDRDPKRVAASLRRALGSRLRDLWPVVDPDGTLRIAVFLALPGEMQWEATSKGLSQRLHSPTVIDHVCLASDGLRARITMAMPDLLLAYADALGLSLAPSLTLRFLSEQTSLSLAAVRVPPVTRLEGVGIRVRKPNGARVETRGPEILDPSSRPAAGGYVNRSTLRFTVGSEEKVDAFLQLPHRLDVSDRRYEMPVRAALAAVGTFEPGKLPDDSWSLAPLEHGEWRWIAVVGESIFARMKNEGRFIAIDAAHVVTREYRMHGAAYAVHELASDPGALYALAEDRSLGTKLVTRAERRAWKLDVEKLRASMMRELGTSSTRTSWSLDGLLDLGEVTVSGTRVRFAYALSEPPRGWGETFHRACGVTTPVVLLPRGQAVHAPNMHCVELDVHQQIGARSVGRALGVAAELLGITGSVNRWRLHDEELILELESKTVHLLGVLVLLSERSYDLLLSLARNGGRVMTTKDLGAQLSSAGNPDVTARKAKAECERQTTDALHAAGSDVSIVERLIVAEGKKGYRLGVAAKILT